MQDNPTQVLARSELLPKEPTRQCCPKSRKELLKQEHYRAEALQDPQHLARHLGPKRSSPVRDIAWTNPTQSPLQNQEKRWEQTSGNDQLHQKAALTQQ